VGLTYAAIGTTLIVQPDRFDATPSYGLLLDIFDQKIWGIVYLLAAAGLGLSLWKRRRRTLLTIAHTFAIALTLVWLGAFVVRYVTDSATTIVNVASWGVYLALLVRSAVDIDDGHRPTPPPSP
jgi:putative Mn2+ efflux pump MntP